MGAEAAAEDGDSLEKSCCCLLSTLVGVAITPPVEVTRMVWVTGFWVFRRL